MRERTVTMGGRPVSLLGKPLQIGDRAPDFQLVDNNLGTKSLADFGNKLKIISAVPLLDTGVCSADCRFNAEAADIPTQ